MSITQGLWSKIESTFGLSYIPQKIIEIQQNRNYVNLERLQPWMYYINHLYLDDKECPELLYTRQVINYLSRYITRIHDKRNIIVKLYDNYEEIRRLGEGREIQARETALRRLREYLYDRSKIRQAARHLDKLISLLYEFLQGCDWKSEVTDDNFPEKCFLEYLRRINKSKTCSLHERLEVACISRAALFNTGEIVFQSLSNVVYLLSIWLKLLLLLLGSKGKKLKVYDASYYLILANLYHYLDALGFQRILKRSEKISKKRVQKEFSNMIKGSRKGCRSELYGRPVLYEWYRNLLTGDFIEKYLYEILHIHYYTRREDIIEYNGRIRRFYRFKELVEKNEELRLDNLQGIKEIVMQRNSLITIHGYEGISFKELRKHYGNLDSFINILHHFIEFNIKLFLFSISVMVDVIESVNSLLLSKNQRQRFYELLAKPLLHGKISQTLDEGCDYVGKILNQIIKTFRDISRSINTDKIHDFFENFVLYYLVNEPDPSNIMLDRNNENVLLDSILFSLNE